MELQWMFAYVQAPFSNSCALKHGRLGPSQSMDIQQLVRVFGTIKTKKLLFKFNIWLNSYPKTVFNAEFFMEIKA